MKAAEKFRQWTDLIGVTVAAQLLGIDLGYVSHLRAGRRTPSLRVACAIERATERPRSRRVRPIRPRDWLSDGKAAA